MSVIRTWFTPSLSGSGAACVEVRFVDLSDLVKDVKPHGGNQLETFVEIGAKTYEVVVDGSQAPDVVSSYLRAQSALKSSFEDSLNELTKWINLQESELSKDKIPLLEPLPLCTDVNSPDFSYEKFFSTQRNPSTFGPRIEQERKNIQEERNRPAGLIGMRLDGER